MCWTEILLYLSSNFRSAIIYRNTSAFFQQGVCSQFISYYSKGLISRYLCKQTHYIHTHHLFEMNRGITDSLSKVGWVLNIWWGLTSWWSPQGSGSMGDMLNLGCLWVSMEYHPYEFLEGYICVVPYCNVELAVCILFIVWDLYSYQGSVTSSFLSSGSGPSLLYNSHHCQSSPPICWSIPLYPR